MAEMLTRLDAWASSLKECVPGMGASFPSELAGATRQHDFTSALYDHSTVFQESPSHDVEGEAKRYAQSRGLRRDGGLRLDEAEAPGSAPARGWPMTGKRILLAMWSELSRGPVLR